MTIQPSSMPTSRPTQDSESFGIAPSLMMPRFVAKIILYFAVIPGIAILIFKIFKDSYCDKQVAPETETSRDDIVAQEVNHDEARPIVAIGVALFVPNNQDEDSLV